MKKVLSIVLSLVMVICMMPVMAFAGTATSADYADASSIQYKEAVDVLSSIGVIDGVGNGLFKPNGNVTREQAAKIICTMLLGDKAEKLATHTAPFKDVAADRWSAPYIAYGVELGILAGVGNGNFNPTGNVTGLQFAKMLLVALGYDARIEKLEGDTWGVRTSALAEDNGLFEGNSKIVPNAAATREEASLYAFNALSADMVKYANKGTEIVLSDGTKVIVGASAAEKVANTASKTIKDDKIMQFAEKYFDKLVLDTANDDFGRPANKWTNDGAKIGTYDTKTPVKTYTTAQKEKDIFSDLGAEGISGSSAKYVVMDQIYVDGELVAKSKSASIDGQYEADDSKYTSPINETVIIAKGDTSNTAGLGEGIKAEIFKTTTANHYTMVITNEYLAKVTSITKADANKDEGRKINLDIYEAPKCVPTFETEKFAKGDYVLVTVANGEVKTVAEAQKVENVAVTSYKEDVVTAGGTTYKYSQYAQTPAKNKYAMSAGNTYTFYLDSCGNVIKDEVYKATNEDYVFVLAKSSADLGDGVVETQYRNVKYIDASGNTTVAKVSTTEAAKVEDSKWYTVKEDEDNAGYSKFAEASGFRKCDIKELSKTQPKLGEGIIANADTVFVLQTAKSGEKAQYKTYTGIANVPSYKAGSSAAYTIVKDGYAKVVYIDLKDATASSTDSDEVIYIFDNTKYSTAYDADNKVTYYVYDAIVNGEKTTVNVRMDKPATNMKKGLIKIDSRDAYGYIQTTCEVTGAGYKKISLATPKSIAYSAPTLKIGTSAYLVDSSTAVYMIDSDDVVTESSVGDLEGTATGMVYIVYKSDKDKTVAAIYFDGSIK